MPSHRPPPLYPHFLFLNKAFYIYHLENNIRAIEVAAPQIAIAPCPVLSCLSNTATTYKCKCAIRLRHRYIHTTHTNFVHYLLSRSWIFLIVFWLRVASPSPPPPIIMPTISRPRTYLFFTYDSIKCRLVCVDQMQQLHCTASDCILVCLWHDSSVEGMLYLTFVLYFSNDSNDPLLHFFLHFDKNSIILTHLRPVISLYYDFTLCNAFR